MANEIVPVIDIEAKRGDTNRYRVTITLTREDPSQVGTVAVWFTAKRNPDDADTAATTIQKTLAQGITWVDASWTQPTPANGTVQRRADIELAPADTSFAASYNYAMDYDVQIQEGTHVATVVEGQLTIKADVTRAIN